MYLLFQFLGYSGYRETHRHAPLKWVKGFGLQSLTAEPLDPMNRTGHLLFEFLVEAHRIEMILMDCGDVSELTHGLDELMLQYRASLLEALAALWPVAHANRGNATGQDYLVACQQVNEVIRLHRKFTKLAKRALFCNSPELRDRAKADAIFIEERIVFMPTDALYSLVEELANAGKQQTLALRASLIRLFTPDTEKTS